ncbi:MAG TPA: DUF72 domain-containing protein, partial [Candidatus Eisenbacteria bacterium]|nr:DUF72 domain-containing protein [Candidatus Eisenbacteria bacterium]
MSHRSSGADRLGEFRVGTSGWAYAWGNFYPRAIPKRDLLAFYSRRFDTVEVNNTFYHL